MRRLLALRSTHPLDPLASERWPDVDLPSQSSQAALPASVPRSCPSEAAQEDLEEDLEAADRVSDRRSEAQADSSHSS